MFWGNVVLSPFTCFYDVQECVKKCDSKVGYVYCQKSLHTVWHPDSIAEEIKGPSVGYRGYPALTASPHGSAGWPLYLILCPSYASLLIES